jgi:hypothetical protein
MIYCRKLFFGLLVTLPLSLDTNGVVQAADPSDQTTPVFRRLVPDSDLQRPSTTASSWADSWQRSTQDLSRQRSGEIRFNKPIIAPVTRPQSTQQHPETAGAPRQSTTKTKPVLPIASSEPPTVIASDQAPLDVRSVVFGRSGVSNHDQEPAETQPKEMPARPEVTQAIASARLQRLPSTSTRPDAAAIASSQPLPAAEPPAPTKTAGALGEPLTDDELQLVSKILVDHQVKPAAEDEALPPAPTGATAVGGESASDIKTGLELADGHLHGDACCPTQPRLFWTAGVESTFLIPDLNSGGASIEVEESEPDPFPDRYDLCSTLTDDVDSVYVAPRIWLGVQGCAWGANLRYWHLQASEGSFDPSIGGLGTWDDFDCGQPDLGFMSCSSLEAYTVDLELTRRFCYHGCAMQASAGVRHAEIEHNEALFALANTEAGWHTGFARANRLSRGTGVQLGLYGRKPVFPCSCVHWFYNARGSALWGPTQTSVETFASVSTNAIPGAQGDAASLNGAYTNVDDTLIIGEIQLGLEWEYALRCIPANAFFRAAFEYQRWEGGMGFSDSQSFAGAEIVGQADSTSVLTASALAAEPQMDLFGVTLGTGLTW